MNQNDMPTIAGNQRRWMRRILQLLIIGAIVAFILYFSRNQFTRNRDNAEYASLEAQGIHLGATSADKANLDEPAPDFVLQDIEGKLTRLSDHRGQSIVVNFWGDMVRTL